MFSIMSVIAGKRSNDEAIETLRASLAKAIRHTLIDGVGLLLCLDSSQ
jgi:hypothetical protein